jgi:hypothetical protein
MSKAAGWTFWIKVAGHMRQLTVAEPDEHWARALLGAKFPEAEFVSRHSVPSQVVSGFFGLKAGEIGEVFPADKRDSLRPGGEHHAGPPHSN